MWAWLKRLVTDEDAFRAAFAGWDTKVRGIIGIIGMLMFSGTIPLSQISEDFGKAGYYLGQILVGLALMWRGGDTSSPGAKALAQANPEQLATGLQKLGVPAATAEKAAEKTAEKQAKDEEAKS